VLPIMNAARALGATLAGTPTPVVFPAMPVAVKTPALPIIVCPPPAGTAGNWIGAALDGGMRMTFEDGDGRLGGFALAGAGTSERGALARKMA
jgi:rubredoxin-NAD+ reductase